MKTEKIKRLAIEGMLAALICIVSFLPLRTLGLEITFSMVPVAIGACLFGPTVGAVLGGVFGVVSFLQCFGYSPFGVMLLGINPWLTALVCIPTRILTGYLSGLVFKGCASIGKNRILPYAAASLAAPILNTIFFMTTLCLCFYNTDYIQSFVTALGAANPFTFVLLFVGINGIVEIITGFLIAFPVSKAISKAIK